MTPKQTETIKYRFDDSIDEKTGKQRHLHQIFIDGEWKPLTGTSSIVKILQVPLTWWASGKAVETLGWLYPKIKDKDGKVIGEVPKEDRIKHLENPFALIKDMNIEAFLDLLDKAYRAHQDSSDESKERGKGLHEELERFAKSKMGKNKVKTFDKRIKPFIDWSEKNVKRFIASEANCYSERLWIGGQLDALAEMKDETLAIIDYKSAKEAYPSAFLQVSGYAIQAEENGLFSVDGKHNMKLDKPISSIIVVPFGAEKIVPEIRYSVDEFKQGFEYAVGLYRILGYEKNNH